MACPKWTLKNQPADLELALHSIDVVIGNENYFGKIYRNRGKEVVTYMDILKETAFEMNKKDGFSQFLFSLGMSKLWYWFIQWIKHHFFLH